jgi:RNA polymerase sigma-70 factor (ECF subfamily)
MPASLEFDEQRLLDALTESADPVVAADALARLMERYKRLTYAVSLQASRDPTLAEDVFQETYLRMTRWLRARPGIEVRSFPRLLCAFVRRTALELARQGRPVSIEASALPLPTGTSALPLPLADAIYARELLTSLPEPARGVLERTIVRGMSSREAADEMMLTPENVRLIKHRAIRAIREQQARDLETVNGG